MTGRKQGKIEKVGPERRRYPRISPLEGSYALLISEQENKLGRILDVSEGGLAFSYLPEHYDEAGNDQSEVKLTIFNTESGSFIEELAAEVVYEKSMADDVFYSTLCMMKCAVRFKDVYGYKQLQLETFLHQCSQGRRTNIN